MKTFINNLFMLPVLTVSVHLMLTGRATAQTFKNLHSFTNSADGANPVAGLILSGNTLYGTTEFGASSGNGTVFAVNTDGTGFTNLYGFMAMVNSFEFDAYGNYILTNSGSAPVADLVLSGNTLYGAASRGGRSDNDNSSGNGTMFAIKTDGTGFTNLHSFTEVLYGTNNDGGNPLAGPIQSGNTLYGTARAGGTNGTGTIFAVNRDGSGFTNLHSFAAGAEVGYSGYGGYYTNSEGISPAAGLILSGNALYGTTEYGGTNGYGTVFAIKTDGTDFTNLHSFTAADFDASYNITNSDGISPVAGLVLSGNALYGTTEYGGSSGNGTIFAVNTDGSGFTSLHSFTAANYDASYNITNSDGISPAAGLVLSGNTLYGTASGGGSSGVGTVFSLSLGSVPAPAPTLTIFPSGANVILTWPTNAAGFTLQSATNLVSTTVWSNVSPAAVVVNTNNAVTNAISGAQKFYRLSQ